MPEPPKAGYLTPMLHVAEIERSIRFYELLGLKAVDTDDCKPIGWARVNGEGGAVMFLRAEEPVDVAHSPVLLYLYTSNLIGLREHLLQSGIDVPPIRYPGYMPSGEIQLRDPDGYAVLIAHWGEAELETWLARIRARGTALPREEY